MSTHTYKITGMHCASCASVITKKLSAVPHVRSVSVNYGTEKAKIDFDDNAFESLISIFPVITGLNKLSKILISSYMLEISMLPPLVTRINSLI